MFARKLTKRETYSNKRSLKKRVEDCFFHVTNFVIYYCHFKLPIKVSKEILIITNPLENKSKGHYLKFYNNLY